MNEAKLKDLWNNFGNIPIDHEEKIEVPFLHFPIGTDRYDIWHWFDDELPNGLHELMRPKKSNTKGFTLIELMVVVSIIGVLLAISFPMMNRMREDAQTARTKSELTSIHTAVIMYYGLNGAFPTKITQLEDYIGIKNIELKYELNPNVGG